ncbi:MAG: DUF2244 domain-containing protein [Rubrivivax sp.]|nr:DUF2244 domain-containing protein [Rubrivivax sp.]
MSATFAPSPWPAPQPQPSVPAAPWVFGREVDVAGRPGAPRALQWLLKRNCSITPRQLGLVYLSLCAVSLAIGALFMVNGAPAVLAFTGIELLAVGLAMLFFARHAGDRETLTLLDRRLAVECRIGTRIERTEFAAEWLSVEPAAGQGSLVQLSGQGQTLRVGRFLRPELRAAFARELRLALRRTSAGLPVTLRTEPPAR